MTRFGLHAKRLKLKRELPDRAKIYCIGHVYLNGDKFKIYINQKCFGANTQLLLYNMFSDKWYDVINKKFDDDL